MKLMSISFSLLTLIVAQNGPEKKIEDLVEDTRTKLCAALAKLEANPNDRRAAEQALAQELARVIGNNIAKLRPEKGSKAYWARDKKFLLVLGANGTNGGNGENVEAEDKQAELVIAIAGDGNIGAANLSSGNGGSAVADAPKGVALALGGQGGPGLAGAGGGGGGGGSAKGDIGSIGLGGEGGPVIGGGGKGGTGGGTGILNAKAIAQTFQKLKKQ